MVEETNNEQATDITPEVEQTQQVWNATVPPPPPPPSFITLTFDEEISFLSANELHQWIDKEVSLFYEFIESNKTDKDKSQNKGIIANIPQNMRSMVRTYNNWYYKVQEIVDNIQSILNIGVQDGGLALLETKKEDLIRACVEFTSNGLALMQSSIGMCARAMSKTQITQMVPSESLDAPQPAIAWLYAMVVLRRQQAEQKVAATQVAKEISDSLAVLESLKKSMEEAQGKVGEYRAELDVFQKDALKSAALKSPANALGKLERGHLKAAGWWFALAFAITACWATFIIEYYFPTVAVPLLENKGAAPFATGAMVLTSVVLTGIVLTSIIILLRLAVARINFSVAAGERKAMAMAFRALLLQHAIPDDQQMLFLQNIVGSKLPDFVNCNDIRMPADELAKIIQAASNVKKD